MTISYNWLKEYIKTDLSANEIAEILTAIGLEIEGVEKIESIKGGLEGLVVAEVLTCVKHPNADKLKITTVSIGSGEPIQVVCGAPNVDAGQKIVLATVGATLYSSGNEEGFTIKKSKIRGEESFGMICAADEIGVGASHEGIIVLPADTPVGTPAFSVFDLKDNYILEVGLTANRVDAASHYGVARDLGVYLRNKATLPSVAEFAVDDETTPANVVVENPELAPRYMGITMDGITIAPSPEWLQEHLRAVGISPKNNVVDITNFVMHECGHPLHAFDLDKVQGGKIIVKTCPEGTPFTTLDGVERKLSSEDLMICSESEPLCLAGVFGGMNSGISDSTTKLFIESAYFNPISTRKSARRHGLSTDSSFRFERGADPNMAPYALMRTTLLIKELAGGSITSAITDSYPKPIENTVIEVSYAGINKIIGKNIPEDTVDATLKALEIDILAKEGEIIRLSVPPYRVDVKCESDIVEEILRIYGLNNIENPHIIKNSITYGNQQTTERLVELVSNLLSSVGYTEIMSNSLTKEAYYHDLETFKIENCVRILNPLSNDLNVMRQTLLFNALEVVQLNSNRKNQDLLLYEIGNCYYFDPTKADTTLRPYSERKKLGIVVTGMYEQDSWQGKGRHSDFYTIKSAVEKIFERLGLNIYEGTMDTLSNDVYGEAVSYTMRNNVLFEMGAVSKKLRSMFDIKVPVYYLELDISGLQKLVNTVKVVATELNKFQPVSRDLALLVDKTVTFSALREAAGRAEKKFIKNISLFDVYEGNKLPEGKKSYALNFVIEDSSKTLTDTEIERIMSNITRALEKATGAIVRS